MQGGSIGLIEEFGMLSEKGVLDIAAIGVRNIQRRRLRRWDGSVSVCCGVVGQHTADVRGESVVGRGS